jgi:hypothetical protein
MEAIIISLLLFFSNADFVLNNGNLDQSAQNTQTTTIEEGSQSYADETVVECSSGGKVFQHDIEGL